MGLDYRYTCKDIDKSIKTFKHDIESYLSNMLDDCCPLLVGEQKNRFIIDYVEKIYKDFETNFEDVRKTNENMREEADRQIDYAEEKLNDTECEIKDLNKRIEQLELQVSQLEYRLY